MRRSIVITGLSCVLLLAFASLMPVQADFGTNWTAEVFDGEDFNSLVTTITGVPMINFTWSAYPVINNQQISQVGNDEFSIRFTGVQVFQQGAYNFVLSYDDGIRLFIDGQKVFDQYNGGPGTARNSTVPVNMTAGNHTIVVEYFDGVGQALVQVQWLLQGAAVTTPGVFTTTPGIFVTPTPLATAVPPLTVSVTTRGLSLRTGPYLGASFIGVARPGTAYVPTARNQDEGTYTWYRITVGERTGWVSGRYLQVTGDPNSVPLVSTIFEQIDGAPDLGVIGVPRAFMNFRRRPSQRAARIGQIPWGDQVQIIGRTRQGGEDFWYQVRWNGQVGWIFAPFVRVDGDINRVPVY
jgi:uncharacterized protein YraI